MTEQELEALIERNEVRKRDEAHWRKFHPNAPADTNSAATDDIDQLLAWISDLQYAIAES